MVVKSATKKKLIDRGISDAHASLLALDRTWDDVKSMAPDVIAISLCVQESVALEVHRQIHSGIRPLSIRSKFHSLLHTCSISILDHVADITADTNRLNLAALYEQERAQPPTSFSDLGSNNTETANEICTILCNHPSIQPAVAASLDWWLDGYELVITGTQLASKTLGALALELAELNYLQPADAEFLGLHSAMVPPRDNRSLQRGDSVASFGVNSTVKSFQYRPYSSSRKQRLRWPATHRRAIGRITYCYSDFIFDVEFDDGHTCVIHGANLVRVVTAQSEAD